MKIKGIHHIGKVVENIEKEMKLYSSLGFETDANIYIDKEQKVKVGKVLFGGKVSIELLEPLGKDSPIWNFSKKGGGLNHVCLEVDSIDEYLKYIKDKKIGFRLTETTVSVFDGRKVCFIGTYNKDILEIIE